MDIPGLWEFFKDVLLYMGIQLTVFYLFLILYHFCIFKRKLDREVNKAKETQEKLQNLSLLKDDKKKSTQLSSLKSEITQESEKTNNKVTKKMGRKTTEKHMTGKGKMEMKKKKPIHEIIEDTQEDSEQHVDPIQESPNLHGNPTQQTTSVISVRGEIEKTAVLASAETTNSPPRTATSPRHEKTQVTGPAAIIEEDLTTASPVDQNIKVVKPTTYYVVENNAYDNMYYAPPNGQQPIAQMANNNPNNYNYQGGTGGTGTTGGGHNLY